MSGYLAHPYFKAEIFKETVRNSECIRQIYKTIDEKKKRRKRPISFDNNVHFVEIQFQSKRAFGMARWRYKWRSIRLLYFM
jgi:hypothetical protein